MTKNIPRSRRSRLLRDMNGQDVTLNMGKYVDGQFLQMYLLEGIIEYTSKIEGGDKGYVFVPNDASSVKRLFIREMDKIDVKSKLIKYAVGKR